MKFTIDISDKEIRKAKWIVGCKKNGGGGDFMLIQLDEAGQKQMEEIGDALGTEELLGQLTEECGELTQAAQKVRRARKCTTPMSLDDALVKLAEECADVALRIDSLIRRGYVSEAGMQFIGRYKNDRWHGRVCGVGKVGKTNET